MGIINMRPQARHYIAIGAWGLFVLRILFIPVILHGQSIFLFVTTLFLMLPVFLLIVEGGAYVFSFATRNNSGKNELFLSGISFG